MYSMELKGGPLERGRAYGESLRMQLRNHIEGFWQGITQGSGQDPHAFVRMWLSEMNFIPAIKRWTPGLLDEVRGIGEGAGLDFETILSWQFLDELGWYIQYIFLPRIQGKPPRIDTPDMACSTFGVFAREGHPTLLAQNWDSHILLDGSQTLLHITYPNSEFDLYVLAAAGRIGPFGVSSRGIGVCLNSLNEFLNFSPAGLPVTFIGRGVLEQPDYQSALAFVQNVQHATGQTYTVGGQEGIAVFECSANQVCRYVPETGANRVVHTNHPIVNTDLRLSDLELEKLSQPPQTERNKKESNTTTRFNSICERLGSTNQVSIETAKSILGSHDTLDAPVCNHPKPESQGVTMMGMIMEFTSPPVLHVSAGRPCETEFSVHTFQKLQG
jgi:isopenicillin-N N-acyltransferase like protein